MPWHGRKGMWRGAELKRVRPVSGEIIAMMEGDKKNAVAHMSLNQIQQVNLINKAEVNTDWQRHWVDDDEMMTTTMMMMMMMTYSGVE